MSGLTSGECPADHGEDRRKSAALAARHTRPEPGAHWIKSADTARRILRNPHAIQAGAGAEALYIDNPEHAPVFFLDGKAHQVKRAKTARFLSPQAVSWSPKFSA